MHKSILLSHIKFFCTVLFLLGCCYACADDGESIKAQTYINKYKYLAVKEMHRVGIPASIKLAQGMLESSYGQSRLALLGNNHFGIKCKTYWTGAKILHDDDAPQECFRKYKSSYESYKDHSQFLKDHPYHFYDHLFKLKNTDYAGWAKGLKKAGYATNPRYSKELIRLIVKHRLYRFDKMHPKDFRPKKRKTAIGELSPAYSKSSDRYKLASIPIQKPTSEIMPLVTKKGKVDLPKPMLDNKRVTSNQLTSDLIIKEKYINNRLVVVANKVLYPYYIAREYQLPLRKVYQFNDIEAGAKFTPNTPIFLEKKRKQPPKESPPIHIVKIGETMEEISQRYGIKLKLLYNYNGMKKGDELTPNSYLYLSKWAKKL